MMLSTQKLTAIAAIAYVLTTAGCSSAPTSKSIVKEQLHIEKQRREVAQQQAEKTIDAMPSPHRDVFSRMFHKSMTQQMALHATVPLLVMK